MIKIFPAGTPNYTTVEIYSEKVELKKYNTFLIFTARRFTENDRLLVEKVKSLKKSFFLIRTQIDVDKKGEKRKKKFNEEEMLKTIRKECLENLKGFDDADNVVFLISNHYPKKWEFARLTKAIIADLPFRQRECLTLSLQWLTSLSKETLKQKVEILRGSYTVNLDFVDIEQKSI